MIKLAGLKIKYTHPASIIEFDVNKVYEIKYENKYFIIGNSGDKVFMDLELIKTLFTPIDKSWDELEKDEVKEVVIKKKEIKEVKEL